MAKSLKSKSKRSFRANKRVNESSVYKQVDEARAKRLSAKLQANASDNKKMSEIGKDDEMVEEGVPEEMQVDGDKDEKKVSTSGPRQAGRRQWKEKKGIKINKRLSQTTTFKGHSQRKGKDGRVKP